MRFSDSAAPRVSARICRATWSASGICYPAGMCSGHEPTLQEHVDALGWLVGVASKIAIAGLLLAVAVAVVIGPLLPR